MNEQQRSDSDNQPGMTRGADRADGPTQIDGAAATRGAARDSTERWDPAKRASYEGAVGFVAGNDGTGQSEKKRSGDRHTG